MVDRAEESLKKLEQAGVAQSSMIQSLIAHARRQIDQVERRLLKGETIAHDEKVFSIFEEHTRWVSKGKAGCAVELGVPVCVVEDQFQFILHHKILWEGSDTDIAVSIINETQALHRDLRVCSFDRGFHSPGNRGQLDAMLDLNALPRKGRLSVAEREREEAQAFAEARRQHPAVESAINNLEHRGLPAPTAPMGLHTPLHCRYWPPTCTASVCLCDGACGRPNDVEDAALPDHGQLRPPPGPGVLRRERPSVPGSRECGPV